MAGVPRAGIIDPSLMVALVGTGEALGQTDHHDPEHHDPEHHEPESQHEPEQHEP